jgi:hypothetical protein
VDPQEEKDVEMEL